MAMRNAAWMAMALLAGAAMADEAEAVKRLERLGGKATKDAKVPGEPVVEVYAANLKKPLPAMKEIKSFEKLRRLQLMNAQVTDKGLAGISGLKLLTVLGAHGNRLTGESLKEVGKMAQLSELDIGSNDLKTEDLRHLAGLKELRRLRLVNLHQVKDEAMKVVAGFGKLEELNLAATGVGDKGLAHLAGLKNLKELNLYALKVTDEGMKAVGQMEKLERLDLADTKVTDAGLLELKGLKHLKRIRIDGTKITDEGRKALRQAGSKAIFGF
jgi:internalin A